jgi:hypothetical protein
MRWAGRAARGGSLNRARIGRWAGVWLCGALLCVLAACGTSNPAPPKPAGGVYNSADFHFTVTYPDGWQPNEIRGASLTATIPLAVVITRTGSDQTSSLLSTFTVTVLNAKDPTIAKTLQGLRAQATGKTPTLRTITLAGQLAWAAQPITQQLPSSQLSATHTDYYLLRGNYEYQLSTDSVAGDDADAALQAMLASFVFTA